MAHRLRCQLPGGIQSDKHLAEAHDGLCKGRQSISASERNTATATGWRDELADGKKKDGGKCIEACPIDALSEDGLDRATCYARLLDAFRLLFAGLR